MDSSPSNSQKPGRAEPRDLLVDYDPTPPASPQSPRLSRGSPPANSNMQSYAYHRGHQSLDNGRENWRAGSYGSQGVPGLSANGTPQSTWAVTNPQRDPRYTQWRGEYSSNPPTTEDLRIIMSVGSGSPTHVHQQYAYCLDRGNGKMTRLIPADMLPPLKEIPRWEAEKPGMMVLPLPSAPVPMGVPATNQVVTLQNVNVANGPISPTGPTRRPAITSPHKSEKEKVYCTKWIHDGTCAFSHPGCRFKHVMPMDKDTQNEVGLYNGLPLWWKKKQAQLNRHAQRTGGPPDMERLTIHDEPNKAGLAGSVPDVPISWKKGEGLGDARGGLRTSIHAHGAPGMHYKPEPIGPPRRDK